MKDKYDEQEDACKTFYQSLFYVEKNYGVWLWVWFYFFLNIVQVKTIKTHMDVKIVCVQAVAVT